MKPGTDYIGVCGSEHLENYVKLKDRTPANEEPWL